VHDEKVIEKFRTATAKYKERFGRSEQLMRLSLLCLENALSLLSGMHGRSTALPIYVATDAGEIWRLKSAGSR